MRQEQPQRAEPVVVGTTKKVPGLRLKQRVREGELTADEAMAILKEKSPQHYAQTDTFKWLQRRGS